MKRKLRFLIVLLSVFISLNAYSQDLIYRPFGTQGTQQQEQSQVVRATAYSQNNNGGYDKLPLRVEVKMDSWGNPRMKVVAYYSSNGFQGRWERILGANQVEICNPLLSYGNQLEKSFMYKVRLTSPAIRTWYFDL